MPLLGLVGYPLSHSFSKEYFAEKFKTLGLSSWSYELYPLTDPAAIRELVGKEKTLVGFNVTIPYKETIINYLDEIDALALETGAVNTVVIQRDGKMSLKGFNTDIYGFEQSIKPLLMPDDSDALILGTGGASRAVRLVFKKLSIGYTLVSRNPLKNEISYRDLASFRSLPAIIVNATPVGMFPLVNNSPEIPYHLLSRKQLLYDLIYNPAETSFLKRGLSFGCRVKNGMEMLCLQADKAWEIWSRELGINDTASL